MNISKSVSRECPLIQGQFLIMFSLSKQEQESLSALALGPSLPSRPHSLVSQSHLLQEYFKDPAFSVKSMYPGSVHPVLIVTVFRAMSYQQRAELAESSRGGAAGQTGELPVDSNYHHHSVAETQRFMRPSLIEFQKEYCVKTKLLALD